MSDWPGSLTEFVAPPQRSGKKASARPNKRSRLDTDVTAHGELAEVATLSGSRRSRDEARLEVATRDLDDAAFCACLPHGNDADRKSVV